MRPMPPALLPHIEQDAPALVFDLGHGGGQLLSAVTAERAEGVSGQTLGMDPAENVLPVADVALHQRDMVLAVQTAHKAVGFEIAVFRGHIHRRDLIHQLFVALAVRLQGPGW